jgi:sulfur carrier protein
MVIKVNGETKTLGQELLAVSQLLSLCNVESPDLVSVQLNGKFVGKDRFSSTILKENDEVDFLYFLGGGQ